MDDDARRKQNQLRLHLDPGRLELLGEWIIDVAGIHHGRVESGAIIRGQIQAVGDAKRQIRRGDPVPAKDDGDVVALVLFVDGHPGRGRLIPTGNEDRAVVVPRAHEEVDLLGGVDVGVARDAGLDDVQERERRRRELPPELLDEIRELRHGIGHLHAHVRAEGAQADARAVGADGVDHGAGDFEREARAVLDAAAVRVGAHVADVLRELVDQVAVGRVDLDAVEARGDRVARRLRVVVDVPPDLLVRQLSRGL